MRRPSGQSGDCQDDDYASKFIGGNALFIIEYISEWAIRIKVEGPL